MKPENIYKLTCKLLREYDTDTGSTVAEQVISNPHKWATFNYAFGFHSYAAGILVECLAAMDTRASGKSVTAAVRRVLESSKKRGLRLDLAGLFQNGGKYVACDGYRLLRLNQDIVSLPHTESDFDVASVMKDFRETERTLALPSVAEIKAYIAANTKGRGRRKETRSYFLDGHAWFNPAYLLDMIQALPGCSAYVISDSTISPVYFKAGNGDGILLPVKPPVNREKEEV